MRIGQWDKGEWDLLKYMEIWVFRLIFMKRCWYDWFQVYKWVLQYWTCPLYSQCFAWGRGWMSGVSNAWFLGYFSSPLRHLFLLVLKISIFKIAYIKKAILIQYFVSLNIFREVIPFSSAQYRNCFDIDKKLPTLFLS